MELNIYISLWKCAVCKSIALFQHSALDFSHSVGQSFEKKWLDMIIIRILKLSMHIYRLHIKQVMFHTIEGWVNVLPQTFLWKLLWLTQVCYIVLMSIKIWLDYCWTNSWLMLCLTTIKHLNWYRCFRNRSRYWILFCMPWHGNVWKLLWGILSNEWWMVFWCS